jgi:hypothetical protein
VLLSDRTGQDYGASKVGIHVYYEYPTRCNNEQSIFYFTARSLYMFQVSFTPIIRSTRNYGHSHWYSSYIPVSWEA